MKLIILIIFLQIMYTESYYPYIKKASKKYGVREYIICRVIEVESNWKQYAVSEKNAIGLMQVTRGVLIDFIKNDRLKDNPEYEIFDYIDWRVVLKNAEWNIIIGTWYISYLKAYFKNLDLVISGYFWGINNIKKGNYNYKYKNKVLKKMSVK